jgi:SAM-dependent methyltransferase
MLSPPSLHQKVLGTLREYAHKISGNYLDVGCGRGELLQTIPRLYPVQAYGCDREPFPIQGVPIAKVNFDRDALPYPSAFFSLVTCTEVLEHLENYRGLLREIYRVLTPGGVAIFSTPNVLNLRSRLRFLSFGFWNLFGPLPWRPDLPGDTNGHISPVPYFYLAHALYQAGFRGPRATIDRMQKSSLALALLLYPPIRLAAGLALWRERYREGTVSEENLPYVREHNSFPLLVGRTLVVVAEKPGDGRLAEGAGSCSGVVGGKEAALDSKEGAFR